MHLCYDEWNVWYRDRGMDGNWAEAPHLLEEVYNLEDALVCAQYLSAFVRRADVVKMACLSQVAGRGGADRSALLGDPDPVDSCAVRVVPHKLCGRARRSLTPMITSPVSCKPGDRGEVPVLDAAAVHDREAGTAALFLTNRSTQQAMSVAIDFADARSPRRSAAS